LAVHLAGQPCDLSSIHALGQSFGFRIPGESLPIASDRARYRGDPIGNLSLQRHRGFQLSRPVKFIHDSSKGRHGDDIRIRICRPDGLDCARMGFTHDPAEMGALAGWSVVLTSSVKLATTTA
jgi:hypothetical protein